LGLCNLLTIVHVLLHRRWARCATTPVPSGGTEPPGRLPPSQVPTASFQGARSLRGASSSPDLRLSSCDPESAWASLLFPRRGRSLGARNCWAGAVPPRAVVCTQPLITLANQSLPIAYRPALGPRNSLECSGSDEPIWSGHELTRLDLHPHGHLHHYGPYFN